MCHWPDPSVPSITFRDQDRPEEAAQCGVGEVRFDGATETRQ